MQNLSPQSCDESKNVMDVFLSSTLIETGIIFGRVLSVILVRVKLPFRLVC